MAPPPLQPADYQQTLRRSFVLGGIGAHTGEFAVVRVRPALAGEGRYFVQVPKGTNSSLWQVGHGCVVHPVGPAHPAP